MLFTMSINQPIISEVNLFIGDGYFNCTFRLLVKLSIGYFSARAHEITSRTGKCGLNDSLLISSYLPTSIPLTENLYLPCVMHKFNSAFNSSSQSRMAVHSLKQ